MAEVATTVRGGTSYVEWGAVFAGAVVAAALSFVLLTFGSAIGLSFTSPWPNSSLSAKLIATLAVFWVMATQIGSFLVGGYIAGRMRARWGETSEHEVDFRDGLHGALVWAVGVVISAALLTATAGSIARTTAQVGGQAGAAVAASNPTADQVDVVLRAAGAAPATAAAAARTATEVSPEQRAEVLRIFAKSVASGSLAEPDKAYLTRIVAQRTGLPAPEAEKRVVDAFTEANRATREAADKARKAAILTGFVTAASLIIALAAAWWGAQRGGDHRDKAVSRRLFPRAPRMPRPPVPR